MRNWPITLGLYNGVPVGRYAVISVQDTGAGMSPEITRRIFDPFFTTKPLGQGTGLGLSMVYGFVRQSGGYIQVSSEEDEGALFTLLFPLIDEPAADAIPEQPIAAVVSSPITGRVMLVEDIDDVRSVVTEQLKSMGYKVTAVADSVAALDFISLRLRQRSQVQGTWR